MPSRSTLELVEAIHHPLRGFRPGIAVGVCAVGWRRVGLGVLSGEAGCDHPALRQPLCGQQGDPARGGHFRIELGIANEVEFGHDPPCARGRRQKFALGREHGVGARNPLGSPAATACISTTTRSSFGLTSTTAVAVYRGDEKRARHRRSGDNEHGGLHDPFPPPSALIDGSDVNTVILGGKGWRLFSHCHPPHHGPPSAASSRPAPPG